MKKVSLLFTIFCCVLTIHAQRKLDYSAKVLMNGKEVTLEQFKGTPLVLDLFDNGCVVCFRVMPKMNELQKEFKGKMNIVLLGKDNVMLPRAYDLYKRKYDLEMSAVYSEGLYNKFTVRSIPHYFWIDSEGIIQGDSGPDKLSKVSITAFLARDYSFLKKTVKKNVEPNEPLPNRVLNSISHTAFSSRNDSINQLTPLRLSITEQKPFINIINTHLKSIFNLAFWGRSIISRSDYDYNENWSMPISDGDTLIDKLLNGLYSYSMAFDSFRSPTFLQEVLKNDLKYHFGLEAVKIEQMMPYWAIQRTDTSSQFLRHNSPITRNYLGHGGVSLNGGSIFHLAQSISIPNPSIGPIIDETGITWLIDLEFEAAMTDIADVQNALAKKGLLLMKKYRPMQVVKVRCINRTIAEAWLPK